MIAALLFAIPAIDQWTPMFDHGDRWPTCQVTYSGLHTKAISRATKDIRKATGIHITYVATGGQITIAKSTEIRPGILADALPLSAPNANVYISGTIQSYSELEDYSSWYKRIIWKHELGHILGLGHTDNPKDLMYKNGPAITKNLAWVSALRTLYPECRS